MNMVMILQESPITYIKCCGEISFYDIKLKKKKKKCTPCGGAFAL